MRNLVNPASLRIRTLLAFLGLFAALFVMLQILAGSIMSRGYLVIEQRTVRDQVQQVANALENSLGNLHRVNRDYAAWDDTYAFMQGDAPLYVETNLVPSTFINLDLSFMAMLSPAGEIRYAQGFDLAKETFAPLPAGLLDSDQVMARLLHHNDADGSLTGLLLLPDHVLLISAQPILSSMGEGPSVGTLLMGRNLDEVELAHLAQVTRLPVAINRFDQPAANATLQQAATLLRATGTTAVLPISEQQILGATRIDDLLGQPGLLLYLELPREVYQLGAYARTQYNQVLLFTALFFTILLFWMLERTILIRLIKLSDQVAAIDSTQSGTHITVHGQDEIAQLGHVINQMLNRLDEARRQLLDSAGRYRQLIELSPDAIIVHDGELIRYSNPAGVRLFGATTSAELVGQPVDPRIGAIHASPDGSAVLLDQRLERPDGTSIEAELVVLPLLDGELATTQVIIRNITERKEVEQTLRMAKEASDVANRAKSQFLSTMSHELRTPLTAIIGYVELIQRDLEPEDNPLLHQDLNRVRAASDHLLALINDVLDLSKVEAGHMPVRPASVQLEILIAAVLDNVRPLAARNSNRLIVEGVADAGMMVADAVHLRQILINLLGNACKFTHNGSVTLRVQSRPASVEEPELVLFVIEDTGIGIRPDQLDLLFRDFVQGDPSSTRQYGGTGLGLALSQRMAHLMGGHISVASIYGEGSTFTLRLPRSPASAVADRRGPLLPQVLAGSADVADDPVPVPTRLVLIIDDDPAVCDLLPRALAGQDLHFELATSGADGLELAMALLPDLIILDVLLPQLDGWSVLKRLKAEATTCNIPVLMLSIDEQAEHGITLGAANFLRKPVNTDALAREVAALLNGRNELLRVLLVEDDAQLRGYLRRTLEHNGWVVQEAGDGLTALELFTQERPDLETDTR